MNGSLSGPRALVIAVLLLAVAAAGPSVDAQQAPKIAKIGLLTPSTPAGSGHLVEPFRQGLRELGHVEGKTFVLEVRYGEGKSERLPELARELVGLKTDVIVVSTDVAIAAVKRETRTIPIVMAVSIDPVGPGSWRASRAPAEMSPGSAISLRSSVGSGWRC